MININSLPDDLLRYILKSLPINEYANFSCTNKKLNNSLNQEILWKNMLEDDFPHVYKKLPQISQTENHYYQRIYKETYKKEYAYLNKKQRRFFELVKNGDLQNIIKAKIALSDLDVTDASNMTPLDWASIKNHQHILHYFYSKAQKVEQSLLQIGPSRTLLHWAILCRQFQEADRLISEANGDLEKLFSRDSKGAEPVHYAAAIGNIALMQALLKFLPTGDQYNATHANGETLLHAAAAKNQLDTVRFLINDNFDVNLAAKITPLCTAAKYGHLETCQALVEAGAEVNISSSDVNMSWDYFISSLSYNGIPQLLRAPLFFAVFNGHLDVIEMLLDCKEMILTAEQFFFLLAFIVNRQNKEQSVFILKTILRKLENKIIDKSLTLTPEQIEKIFSLIAMNLHLEVIPILFEKFSFNLENLFKEAAILLCFAIQEQQFSLVKLLVEKGADVNQRYPKNWCDLPQNWNYDYNDRRPIHIAVITGSDNPEMVSYLIEQGADINTFIGYMITPLYLAVGMGNVNTVKVLLNSKKLDERIFQKQIDTLINIAIESDYFDIATLLFRYITVLTKYEKEIINLLVCKVTKCGTSSTLTNLIDIGIDIKKSYDGDSLLLFAISGGQLENVKILITYGLDVNSVSPNNKMSPLYLAAKLGHEKIVELLLNNGAEVDMERAGKSALSVAVKKGHYNIVKLLEQKRFELNSDKKISVNVLQKAYRDQGGNKLSFFSFFQHQSTIVECIKSEAAKSPPDSAAAKILEIFQTIR